ncbi:hypothetical protein ACN47E_000153 [Coniothyrium glycines]
MANDQEYPYELYTIAQIRPALKEKGLTQNVVSSSSNRDDKNRTVKELSKRMRNWDAQNAPDMVANYLVLTEKQDKAIRENYSKELRENGKSAADAVRFLHKVGEQSKAAGSEPPGPGETENGPTTPVTVTSGAAELAPADNTTKSPARYPIDLDPEPKYSKGNGWPDGVDDSGCFGWPWPNDIDEDKYREARRDGRKRRIEELEGNGTLERSKKRPATLLAMGQYQFKLADYGYTETDEQRRSIPANTLLSRELLRRVELEARENHDGEQEEAEARGESCPALDGTKDTGDDVWDWTKNC